MEKSIPEPFLKKVADYIHALGLEDLSDLTVVLPNRRAGLFLHQYLSARYDSPIWSPNFQSIEEFLFDMSGYRKADPTVLLMTLYHAYRSVMEESAETFETFMPWGQVLLDDFNELDAYLVSVDAILSYLSEAKAIELWNPGAKSLSEAQQGYLRFYRSLGLIYRRFTELLLARGEVYPGLAGRLAIEHSLGVAAINPPAKLIFAGLNALSEAESRIVRYFRREHGAKCLWDTDAYYMDDFQQEAGSFLRDHREHEGDSFQWIEHHIGRRPLQVSMIGVPGKLGQVKMAAKVMQDWIKQGIEMDQQVAVVLADEGLILPMLNAIPLDINDINVTMGLPLRQTSGYSFLDSWLALLSESAERTEARETGQRAIKLKYRLRGVLKMVMHPWIYHLLPADSKARQVLRETLMDLLLNQGIPYADPVFLHGLFIRSGFSAEDAALFFPDHIVPAAALPGLGRQIIRRLQQGLGEAPVYQSEEETCYAFSTLFGYLEELWTEFKVSENQETLRKIFDRICRTKQLSFSGEPLKGLQLMGLLETRSLDFERVILLSANEDILPSGKQINSFIPFDIRQQFGLPNQHYRAAVFAYHFYRMLQRGKEMVCLYNTEPGELGGGEKSRFLSQLLVELRKVNPVARIEERTVGLIPSHQQSPAIKIIKDPAMLQVLRNIATRGLSASSLNVFRACSLRFYLKYIARIEEQQDESEELGSKQLGDLVHNVLLRLYESSRLELLSSECLLEWLKNVEKTVLDSFQHLYKGVEHHIGKNLLLFELSVAYVRNMLEHEAKWIQEAGPEQRPTILELEKLYQRALTLPGLDHVVNLRGTFDRVDKVDGKIRIIDYKTGVVGTSDVRLANMDDISDSKKDKAFQLLLYAWIFRGSVTDVTPLKLAIIKLQALGSGPQYLSLENSQDITSEALLHFEGYLSELIMELMNPDVPFQQAIDEDACKYCSYQRLCNRVPVSNHY